MDLRTVMTISALFLMAESKPTTSGTVPTSTITQTTPPIQNCTCRSNDPPAPPAPSITSTPDPDLAFLTIRWTQDCEGDVMLYDPSSHNLPRLFVCYHKEMDVLDVMTDVCQHRKGCTDKQSWDKGGYELNSYDTKASGAERRKDCKTLKVKCEEEGPAGYEGQLQAYKVVTALLCCVLLILLLIRFTKPTVNALQKRLSDRRQNRWIGPTQSHSVSYHRGKNTVKNNDGEKRLSYPALERLTVSSSREPSSARNSYNF